MSPDEARKYLEKSNRGEVVWDDNLRVKADDALKKGQQSDPAFMTQRLIQQSIDTYNQKLQEYNKKYNEFETNNPFVFDKVLEEEKAKVKQRLDPYYEQTLSDYLTGVNTKRRRSLEDERTLLTELSRDVDRFEGREKAQLDDVLERTREGFADAGLYESGARLRAEGREKIESKEGLQDYMQNTDSQRQRIEQSGIRTSQDLELEESMRKRDLGREQEYQTGIQALPEVERRQQQREFERGQYTGAPAGVDPTQYQNSLYQFLR